MLSLLAGLVLALPMPEPEPAVVHMTPFGEAHVLAVYEDGNAAVLAVDFDTFELVEVSSYTARPKAPPVFRTRWRDATGTEHEIETKVDEAEGDVGQAEAIKDAFALHTTLVTLAQEQYPPVVAAVRAFVQPGGLLRFAPERVLDWPADLAA